MRRFLEEKLNSALRPSQFCSPDNIALSVLLLRERCHISFSHCIVIMLSICRVK